MQVKIVTGATTFEAAVNTIKKIDAQNLEYSNLVVVPDAFSMQAENLLFKTLDISSTFNIEVVGISRLAAKILRSNNISCKRISALEEIFNIYKAVKSCESEFTYFSHCGVEFCIKILQIIKQFKGCKISPNAIKTIGDDLLDRKMHDLKLVYIKYESLMQDKMDLSKLLEFFIENAQNTLDLSKINLYFVNFDSFSLEVNSFICNLAKYVASVHIGMAKPHSPRNAFIFEDDILRKTTQIAKQNNITVEVENPPCTLPDNKLKMAENLFAFDVEKGDNDYFLNVLAKNAIDEVDFVAKYIKREVVKGGAFKDFAIACADKKYFSLLKDTFEKFKISMYCDDAVDLSQTILGRFLFKMLDIAKQGFSYEDFEYLSSTPLLSHKGDELFEIFRLQIDDKNTFLQHFPQYKPICDCILNLKKCKTLRQFEIVLKEILQIIENNYNNFILQMEDERYFKKQSENQQSQELVLKVLEKLTLLGEDEEFDIFDFENLLKLAFKSVKVETIPTYIDAVYVGDATDSYFEDVKTLFVLGGNSLPRQHGDTGIIDDDDIKKLRINFALEPEIKVLNRRNRLKLFECLQHANQRLVVTCPMAENGKQAQRAEFVDNLLTMFGNNILHTVSMEEFPEKILSCEENVERLLFAVGCKENLSQNFYKLKLKLPSYLENALENMIEDKAFSNEIEYIKTKKTNRISASELECYFACPFKHFLQYTLNVKPRENALPNKRSFGIFQHALLKEFMSQGEVQKMTDKQIDDFIENNLQKFAKQVYEESVLDKPLVKFLRNESKVILKNVVKEQKNSNFRPIYLEEKIAGSVGDKNFVGFIDRVDRCGKYFRIIDYKTGKTDNLKKDLYYGKKLQLFLYAKAAKEKTGLVCSGVYYFDCQTKYSKANSKSNLLNGMTLKENEVVENTDIRLDDAKRSDLIGVSLKKNVKDGEFAYKNGNTVENLDEFMDYAQEVSQNAVSEIENGYVAAKPFKDECKICPYISVCRHGLEERKTLKEKKEE